MLFLVQACASTVDPGYRGLRRRPITQGLGKETLRDGFYMHMPWNNVFEYNNNMM